MAKKNTNQLVPVQRQVTRGGKTFMTTVWVKPRHASSSTSASIEVPEWEFSSAKEFQDEFDRINSMKDKTARQYLKQQLLDHVEKNLGAKYDKVPDSDPRAFVKNSLRGFSAAKKHLDEGKGYAVKPEKAEDKAKDKSKDGKPKREPRQKKQSAKKKLPTAVVEAYDRATPVAKAVALATGIVAEDEATENWLLERLINEEMSTHKVEEPASKSLLEGGKDFEESVNLLKYTRLQQSVRKGLNYNMSESGLDTVMRSFVFGGEKEDYASFLKGEKKLSDFKDSIVKKFGASNRELRNLFPEGFKGKEINDAIGTLVDGYDEYNDALAAAHEFDLTDPKEKRVPSQSTNIMVGNAEMKIDRGVALGNYLENLTTSLDKKPTDITYSDMAKRQLEKGEKLNNLSTDEIWEEFEIDTLLNNVDPYVLERDTFYSTSGLRMSGGDTELFTNAFAMTNIHGYRQEIRSDAGILSNAVWDTFAHGMDEAITRSDDLQEIFEKINRTPRRKDEVPSPYAIKSAYESGVISKEEVVKIVKPGLHAVSQGFVFDIRGVEVTNASIVSGEGSDEKPFADMLKDPGMPDYEDVYSTNWSSPTAAGMTADPFASVRLNAETKSEVDKDIGLDLTADISEIARVAKNRREKSVEAKRKLYKFQSNKKLRNASFKLQVAMSIGEHKNMYTTSNRNKIEKFRETIANHDVALPSDEFLDDGRIPMDTKIRYASRMSITPPERRESMKKKLDAEVALKHNISMPGVDLTQSTAKETKADKVKRVQRTTSASINDIISEDPTISVRELKQKLGAGDVLEASELTKTAVKTSMGSVDSSTLNKLSKEITGSHDKVNHSGFKADIHGAYEIKSSVNDDKYEAKKAELSGGETRMLYHGTSFATSQLIFGESGGFKVFEGGRKIKSGSMLGYGVYLADKSSKSAQYISNSGFSRSSDRGVLMVCESYLGKVEPFNFSHHMGRSHADQSYDTIEALTGNSGLKNNEWCVTSAEQARPKYIIDYERKRTR